MFQLMNNMIILTSSMFTGIIMFVDFGNNLVLLKGIYGI
jgi:hypothetical protein